VISRHLTNRGAEVAVLLLAEIADVFEREDETATNARIAQNMGIPIRELLTEGEVAEAVAAESATDLIVDAMLGTGVTGELREPYLTAVEAVNMAGAARLAVDVPSGLDCDTGRPLGAAVKADRTVTFVFQKAGFLEPGAAEYTGEVDVAEISVPRVAIERKVKEWQSEAT
jgi:NAD(P)H-hydrate epimerase